MKTKELELENIKFFTELLQEELQDELQENLPNRSVQVIRAVRSERSGKVQFLLTASINGALYLEKNSNCLLALRSIVKEYRSKASALALAEISAAAYAINEAAAEAAAEKEAKAAVKTPTLAEAEAKTLSLEKSSALRKAKNEALDAEYLDLEKAIAKWQAGFAAAEAMELPPQPAGDGLFEQLASAMNPAAYYPAASLLAAGGSHV
jgi:hypothetical protein